jgi:DNA helicase HerA-like ATPase
VARPEQEVAPVVSFPVFLKGQVRTNAEAVYVRKDGTVGMDGIHRLAVGQTRSGKTTLLRILARLKRANLVLGTKPGRDTALEAYESEEGYTRIETWPPKNKDLRPRRDGTVRLLLWPKITTYGQLRSFAPTFRSALHHVIADGNWTTTVDEGLWVCSTKGLDLASEVSEISYGGASNGNSLHVAMQRPSGVPVIIHDQCQESYIFELGNENDLRNMASYSKYSPLDTVNAVRSLNRSGHLHQFLHLPRTGGAGRHWEVTEVDPRFL